MEADSGRVISSPGLTFGEDWDSTFGATEVEVFQQRIRTLLDEKYGGWLNFHDKDPSPVTYTVSIKGMEYTYNKGYIGVQVKFRPVYYSKNPWFGDWQIASPLALEPGAVEVHRKDGTSSVHVVGAPVLKNGTNRVVNDYGQETYLYVVGPTTTETPQEVPTHMVTLVPRLRGQIDEALFGAHPNGESTIDERPHMSTRITDSTEGERVVVANFSTDAFGQRKVEPAQGSAYRGTFTLQSKDQTKKYSITASSWKDAVQQLVEKREPLSNMTFAGMDLSLVTFRTALRDSTFQGCNLSDSSYTYGDLRGATLDRCNLENARFQGTIADKTTVLKNIDLSKTEWFRVKSVVQFATLIDVTGVPKDTPSNIVLQWFRDSPQETVKEILPEETAKETLPEETLPEKSTYVAITKEIAEMAKPNFKEMVLSDAEKAAYRITARSVVNLGRDAILKILAAKGGSQAEAFSLMLDTEVGTSVVSGVMGGVLTALPQFQNDTRVQKLAEELRVNGMATLGNTVVDQLTELVAPAMSAMMSGAETVAARVQAPPAEVYKKPTLVQPKEELHDEHHEEEVETEALKSATLR